MTDYLILKRIKLMAYLKSLDAQGIDVTDELEQLKSTIYQQF